MFAAFCALQPPRICRFKEQPFILVEFSDGAYRFGHAEVRGHYDVNARLRDLPLFPRPSRHLSSHTGTAGGLLALNSERPLDP
jgi:hypothetical protein